MPRRAQLLSLTGAELEVLRVRVKNGETKVDGKIL